MYKLFITYKEFKKRPSVKKLKELYKYTFDDENQYGKLHKWVIVFKNLITGKYKKFYQYYKEKYK